MKKRTRSLSLFLILFFSFSQLSYAVGETIDKDAEPPFLKSVNFSPTFVPGIDELKTFDEYTKMSNVITLGSLGVLDKQSIPSFGPTRAYNTTELIQKIDQFKKESTENTIILEFNHRNYYDPAIGLIVYDDPIASALKKFKNPTETDIQNIIKKMIQVYQDALKLYQANGIQVFYDTSINNNRLKTEVLRQLKEANPNLIIFVKTLIHEQGLNETTLKSLKELDEQKVKINSLKLVPWIFKNTEPTLVEAICKAVENAQQTLKFMSASSFSDQELWKLFGIEFLYNFENADYGKITTENISGIKDYFASKGMLSFGLDNFFSSNFPEQTNTLSFYTAAANYFKNKEFAFNAEIN